MLDLMVVDKVLDTGGEEDFGLLETGGEDGFMVLVIMTELLPPDAAPHTKLV